MRRLTRDGTAKPVSRNQIFRRERGTRIFFPVQLTMNRIGNLPVDWYSAICHDNTYIHTAVACTLNSRLLSGHLGISSERICKPSEHPPSHQGENLSKRLIVGNIG